MTSDNDGLKITAKTIRTIVIIFVCASTFAAGVVSYWDMRVQVGSNARSIAKLESLIVQHAADDAKHPNREAIAISREQLQQRMDDVQKRISEMSTKLDAILLRQGGK